MTDLLARLAISFVVTTIVGAVAARTVRRARSARARIDADGDPVVTYSLPMRIVGTFGWAGFATLTLWLAATAPDDGSGPIAEWVVGALVAGVALAFTHVSLRYALSETELQRDGLVSRAPWRRPRFIAWNDVQRIEWSDDTGDGCFRIWAGDRPQAKVYIGMTGIPDFFDALKRKVPRDRWAHAFAGYESRRDRRHNPPKSRKRRRRRMGGSRT